MRGRSSGILRPYDAHEDELKELFSKAFMGVSRVDSGGSFECHTGAETLIVSGRKTQPSHRPETLSSGEVGVSNDVPYSVVSCKGITEEVPFV